MSQRKLAVLRGEDLQPCPFGLKITFGCANAGDLVSTMAPLYMGKTEEEKEQIISENNYILEWQANGVRCQFNNALYNDKVNCGFEDGIDMPTSPPAQYDKNFSHMGLTGLMTYPNLGFWDNSLDRGYYYGAPYIESVANNKENK